MNEKLALQGGPACRTCLPQAGAGMINVKGVALDKISDER
ncbi:MAG: hypothetical protein MOIL_01033 [Candidatus Methanolliviera sp. GoM_oil]|nr:MAG: hypothetical protein MOIL_01033 [Candidatus Methanolliviera sp. GoM_oil]